MVSAMASRVQALVSFDCGSKPRGGCTTHFSGNWDVHWGYDLDPWPFGGALLADFAKPSTVG